jgi:flavin reductase (DIM6/NTAB) family NADH-FMN oxidoreductase RutF
MKHELSSRPDSMKWSWEGQFEIFSWVEVVCSVPQAISIVTTWKEGHIPNACPQSWTMYAGDSGGYYVIMSMLNNNHTCKNILSDKDFVVNFPGTDLAAECMKAVEHFPDETDEITACGLTVEPAAVVDAPRIKECFLNMECRLGWERPLHEGSLWHVFAGEVLHVAIDADVAKGGEYNRSGPAGFMYNIHSPTDPATGHEDPPMYGIIRPVREM